MTALPRELRLFAPDSISEILPGSDLATLFLNSLKLMGEAPRDGDVVVFAQKIVSKSEARLVRLDEISPGADATELAEETGKDPRLVELILQESTEIVRKRENLIIARHRNGCVVANAGIDLSNSGEAETAILLPADADRSAKLLGEGIHAASGCTVSVVINDSMGRAWRMGTSGTAIGSYGIPALHDRRGATDRDGNVLQSSEIAIADEISAAASLIMGQGDESLPIVVMRGLDWVTGSGSAADLVRPPAFDLFS
jgi:coenzyme F420-0:L-glutamate ligase / coenzyme F420-1:gamma-L-glutamate ligase